MKEHALYFGGAENVPIDSGLIVHFRTARARYEFKQSQDKTDQAVLEKRIAEERAAVAAKRRRENSVLQKTLKQNEYQSRLAALEKSIAELEEQDLGQRQLLIQTINMNSRLAAQSKSNELRASISKERAVHSKVMKEYIEYLKKA